MIDQLSGERTVIAQTEEGLINTMFFKRQDLSYPFCSNNARRTAILVSLLILLSPCGNAWSDSLSLEQVLRRVQEVYSHHCCFRASFDQLTVNTAMDLKDRFQGTMYVRKPASIALEVESPEKQKVVMQGRSYTVYFHQDGSAVRGEVPSEINVEHFFGFFTNIGNIDRNFSMQFPARSMDKEENLIFIELAEKKNQQNAFRILLGVDSERFTIRRAIIYDALGNYNRCDLEKITFLPSIQDSTFQIGGAEDKAVRIPRIDSAPE